MHIREQHDRYSKQALRCAQLLGEAYRARSQVPGTFAVVVIDEVQIPGVAVEHAAVPGEFRCECKQVFPSLRLLWDHHRTAHPEELGLDP